jgi:hypothetical protein
MDRITHQSSTQQGYGSTSSLRNDSLKHTRKHKRRREESNQGTKLSASGGLSGQAGRTVRKGRADSPARCRGQSARDTRTVRPGATDRTLKTTEPPEPTREKRTVRERRADRPRGFRTVLYWSSDRPRTGCNDNLKPRRIEGKGQQEHEELAKNTHVTDCPPPARGLSAPCGQSWNQVDLEGQPLESITGSPKRYKLLRQKFGDMICMNQGCYTPKISSANSLNHRESQILWTPPKARAPNENPWIEVVSRRLREQDQSQRCTRHPSMFPSKKSRERPTQIQGITPRTKAPKTTTKKTTENTTPNLLYKPGKIHTV